MQSPKNHFSKATGSNFSTSGCLRGDISFGSRPLKELNAICGAVKGQDGDDFVDFIASMSAF